MIASTYTTDSHSFVFNVDKVDEGKSGLRELETGNRINRDLAQCNDGIRGYPQSSEVSRCLLSPTDILCNRIIPAVLSHRHGKIPSPFHAVNVGSETQPARGKPSSMLVNKAEEEKGNDGINWGGRKSFISPLSPIQIVLSLPPQSRTITQCQ